MSSAFVRTVLPYLAEPPHRFLRKGNNFVGGNGSVDPRLFDVLDKAATATGLDVEAISGLRKGDPRQHGKGGAIDIQLYDSDGKPIPNYQSPENFRKYEQFAQVARSIQQKEYPELGDQFRWGGYFGGPKGKYGAMDLMHFDLGGGNMAGGAWDTGLTPEQRKLFPDVVSVGMAAGTPPQLTLSEFQQRWSPRPRGQNGTTGTMAPLPAVEPDNVAQGLPIAKPVPVLASMIPFGGSSQPAMSAQQFDDRFVMPPVAPVAPAAITPEQFNDRFAAATPPAKPISNDAFNDRFGASGIAAYMAPTGSGMTGADRGMTAMPIPYGGIPMADAEPIETAPLPQPRPSAESRIPEDVFTRGSSGSSVAAVQEALSKVGLDPGEVDGEYGRKTANAVRAFQRLAGITIDGKFGPQTLRALRQALDGNLSPAAEKTTADTYTEWLRQNANG